MIEKGDEKKRIDRKKKESFLARLNIYSFMAHYVAKVLKLRPNDILDHWGVSELIVAYGMYANEQQHEAHMKIKDYNKTAKKKMEQVNEYAVMFYSKQDLIEEAGGEMDG